MLYKTLIGVICWLIFCIRLCYGYLILNTLDESFPVNSAHETAKRLVDGMRLRGEDAVVYRFQMSMKGLATIAERERVDDFFLTQLSSELFSSGWCMFRVSHTSFGFISVDKAEKWRKLSGEKMSEALQGESDA